MSEIWAILEYDEAAFHENSAELLADVLAIARKQPSARVCAVILTAPDVPLPDTSMLANLGVHTLSILEHPQLAQYTTGGYASALAWLIQQHSPLLVTTSASANGRDWMPRLAARLRLPFVSGCLGLELHDEALFALRSVYEGRAYIQTRTPLHGHTALATFMPGIRGTPVKTQVSISPTPSLTITHLVPDIPASLGQERIQHLATQAPSPEQVELDAAERIVAGGRGIGQDGFTRIAAFARLLGAAVGATRVATDRGWVEHARQIGATGKSVHPKIYIACGISGAAQHTSGMREAQTVVAINPDRTAPIFALADLGLLGDANQVVTLAAEMIEQPSTSTI
ncbi:MAG TPA: electron transfer flavoprotein subunit alpha/FixB family protein [Ktedonobacteraceae bacterium]|nr:electron transfer flavoprotein subunit alpha/FixB family protein [Ktedonobacteraceae bacterium]